jgi:hypothetical protein
MAHHGTARTTQAGSLKLELTDDVLHLSDRVSRLRASRHQRVPTRSGRSKLASLGQSPASELRYHLREQQKRALRSHHLDQMRMRVRQATALLPLVSESPLRVRLPLQCPTRSGLWRPVSSSRTKHVPLCRMTETSALKQDGSTRPSTSMYAL